MTEYLLTIELPGEPAVRRVTGETLSDLAEAVHRHARGVLGSTRVDIRLDESTLTGTVIQHGAVTGRFALDPVNEPTAAPGPERGDGIRWGWSLADLDRLARTVVSNNRTWWPAGDRDDLYAAAWHGIVERLYTADEEPGRIDLMEAGRAALADDVRSTMRHHGARRDTSNNGAHYATYWQWAGRAVPSPEAAIVERAALWQILPALTPGQLAAVHALATAGDYEEAARLFGASQTGLKSQLMKGRRRFRELWHEGEMPSTHWGCDRRAGTVRGTVGEGSAVARIRRRAKSQEAA